MKRINIGIWVTAAALMLLASSGCETWKSVKANMPDLPVQRPNYAAEAQQAYDAGDYVKALDLGEKGANLNGITPDEPAAYIAGASAYRLKKPYLAERYLVAAGRSRDAKIAGPALAQLGVIYAETNRYEQAAESLTQAANFLEGKDKANAYYYAARADRELGRWAQTRTLLTLAQKYSTNDAFTQSIATELSATGWTIQVASFDNEIAARRFAEQLAVTSRSLSIGLPKLVTTATAQGAPLYLVQIGQFSRYEDAAQKRRDLGVNEAVVVPFARQ